MELSPTHLHTHHQGLWATGTAAVISPVLKGRRKRPSASASSTAPAVRAPSRAVLLLRLPATLNTASSSSSSSNIAVILQGERCLRCQPALRPGRRYHFPLLRPADPEASEDERADYWGEAAAVAVAAAAAAAASTPPPPVFIAVLPPVEMHGGGGGDGGGDFAARPGLFAYPDHRPRAVEGAAAASECCLQARVVHFEGVIRGAWW